MLSWVNILTMPAIALVITTAAYQRLGYDPSNGFALVMSVLLISGGATHAVGQSWECFVVDRRTAWYPDVERAHRGISLRAGAGSDILLPSVLKSAGIAAVLAGFTAFMLLDESDVPTEIMVGCLLFILGYAAWRVGLAWNRHLRIRRPGDIELDEHGLRQRYSIHYADVRWNDLTGRFTLVSTRRHETVLKLALRPLPGSRPSIDLWVDPVTSNAYFLIALIRLCYRDPALRGEAVYESCAAAIEVFRDMHGGPQTPA